MVFSYVHFVFFIVICYLKYLQVRGCSGVYLECLMTSFKGNICNPVPWGECQQLIIQDQEFRLNLWSCWLWYILHFHILEELNNHFLAFFPDTVQLRLLHSSALGLCQEPVGLVALRKIKDKPTNFLSNSFGMHNVQRMRREWCLLNWIICFGLKGKLFLELYLWCELTEVFWSSVQQEQGLFYQQMWQLCFVSWNQCLVTVSPFFCGSQLWEDSEHR